MTVLDAATAFLEKSHELNLPPALREELAGLEPGQLAELLMQDLPEQGIPATEWEDSLSGISDPSEGAFTVRSWIKHRVEAARMVDFTDGDGRLSPRYRPEKW